MRNTTFSPNAMNYLGNVIQSPACYITALSFKFCFLEFNDVLTIAEAMRFNKTIVKLDLSKNAIKSVTIKWLLDSLVDNYCLAHLDLSGNYLDNEFSVDLAHLLETNQQLHTVDLSNNPIEPEGAKYLLQSILSTNDTLESLGDLEHSNMLMGVRNREEIRQALTLNVSNHERKRIIMQQIEQTKANNPNEKNLKNLTNPLEQNKKLEDDKSATMDVQMKYPMLKPVAFSNPLCDDYIYSGVWHIKSTY